MRFLLNDIFPQNSENILSLNHFANFTPLKKVQVNDYYIKNYILKIFLFDNGLYILFGWIGYFWSSKQNKNSKIRYNTALDIKKKKKKKKEKLLVIAKPSKDVIYERKKISG